MKENGEITRENFGLADVLKGHKISSPQVCIGMRNK
jgi:hypothetical protein